MTTKLSADDISRLFDIEPGPNLDIESDYGMDSSGTRRPFEDTVEDLKAVMVPEKHQPLANAVDDALVNREKHVGVPPPESSGTMVGFQELDLESRENPLVSDPVVCQGDEKAKADGLKALSAVGPTSMTIPQQIDPENPLDLAGYDLDAYNDLCRDHPQFCLYDGSQSFKGFYRHKVTVLKSLLSTFPILPLVDYLKELGGVCINHQVGNATVSPELIRKKIDDIGIARTRVVEILSEALSQYPVWEKSTHMLSGKLWKDHESKGAHKREGLNTEHMREMIMYVEKLKGFIDSAKTIDGFLKSASDGLSRQLSCVQVRQYAGISSDNVLQMFSTVSRDTSLDAFDTVPEGTVISEPKNGGALIHHDFGAPAIDDEFADIG